MKYSGTIARGCADQPKDRLVIDAIMTLTIPSVHLLTNALVVYPGLGEYWRVAQAVRDWNSRSCRARHLLIAGHNQAERTARPWTTKSVITEFGVRRHRGLIVTDHANHTLDQAEWVTEFVVSHELTSLALYAPPYHIVRAWMTTVKQVVCNAGIWIPIIPRPTIIDPFTYVPEYLNGDRLTNRDMISGELTRIRRYRRRGNVASHREISDYLEWLYHQPMLSVK